MALKRSFWNFQCGSRGVIFLLDMIIALFIVVFMLTASIFFVSRAEESSISKLQANRISNDIFAILDYDDVLRDFNINKIRNEIDRMLPEGYSMEYKIDCENRVYDSRTGITSDFIFAGERVFVDKNFNNCIVRHWVWLS